MNSGTTGSSPEWCCTRGCRVWMIAKFLDVVEMLDVKLTMNTQSNPKNLHNISLRVFATLLLASLYFMWDSHPIHAQNISNAQPAAMSMQHHYNAAEQYQSENEFEQAKIQYQLFLAEALRKIASNRVHLGKYEEATPLFDAALKITPNDPELLMDYAQAAFAVNDNARAKTLAQEAIHAYPDNANPASMAAAHSVLGRALWALGSRQEGLKQLEEAEDMDPSMFNGHSLSTAYLALADKQDAKKLFAKMLHVYGDSAALHMDFGRTYALAGDLDESIQEFKYAIQEDDRLPGLHYSLGAAYLLKYGNTDFPEIKKELQKDLSIDPKDSLSYYLLGYIAFQQHDLPNAILNLSHSVRLNKQNPDACLMLGKIYFDMGKIAEAEVALRQAINTTHDPSRNHYQIKGAYYELGRILMQSGHVEEGKKYIEISERLLLQNKSLDRENITGVAAIHPTAIINITPDDIDRNKLKAVTEYDAKLGLAIADVYNNLGVISAINNEYIDAIYNFKQASSWNPSMEGIDKNLGRALFKAQQYDESIQPLTHALAADPSDIQVRTMLGMSNFYANDFSHVVSTLGPMESEVQSIPLLGYMYAESLIKTGNYDDGIHRLLDLEKESPGDELLHNAISEAYAANRTRAGDFTATK